jgi:predicted N-acetyltransferase YhbS
MMMVDPAYQNMGVGRLLVKWGLTQADELGVDVSDQLQM